MEAHPFPTGDMATDADADPRTMHTDYLIIGAGIIGLTVALELKRRFPQASIMVLEKESAVGQHASGRNSGVLHAGFYYSADSLKARFCRDGNQAMRAYCKARGLPLNQCGKLVVAKNHAELAGLDELHRRGRANGVEVTLISEAEAKRIEPRVKTVERALWSPNTASADPGQVIAALARDASDAGITLRTGIAYRSGGPGRVLTADGAIDAGYVINCAGLYADRVGKDFGFCQRYTILPFKGLYLYSDEPHGALRTHIYPVPDLKFPFLGVHFTVTVDGHSKIGPTAIPAFWREHYTGLERFDLAEAIEIAAREASLMVSAGFDFRNLARLEMRKFSPSFLVGEAGKLLEGVNHEDYTRWGRPGIRAQLLDLEKRTLVMDFLIEGDRQSLHVLNAVSPAWTCSMPFAAHVVDQVVRLRDG
jgi:L-2-hydroxyglutarate oxidase LhgO